MKIAILTLTPKSNYGGILQAVALYSFLESKGYEVILINKKRFEKPLVFKVAKRVLERIPFQNIKNKRHDYLKAKHLEPFLVKYLPKKSKEIVSAKELQELVEDEEFKAVIVGSDQVWRYQYIGDGHYNVFFLDFKACNSVKKIAYAASFGKDEWEAPEHINKISHLLSDFYSISTREKSGVTICQNIFGISDVKNVLDPTMLVGARFYNRFIRTVSKENHSKSIVTYVLDKDQKKSNIIDSIKDSLEVIKQGPLKQVNLTGKGKSFYSIEEWLWHIKNSDIVVTDSFHGMVFSILFERNFIVIGNPKRGLSRFTDLLDSLGLTERLLLTEQIPYKLLDNKIDYAVVSEKISKMRVESEFFLLNSLGQGVAE